MVFGKPHQSDLAPQSGLPTAPSVSIVPHLRSPDHIDASVLPPLTLTRPSTFPSPPAPSSCLAHLGMPCPHVLLSLIIMHCTRIVGVLRGKESSLRRRGATGVHCGSHTTYTGPEETETQTRGIRSATIYIGIGAPVLHWTEGGRIVAIKINAHNLHYLLFAGGRSSGFVTEHPSRSHW